MPATPAEASAAAKILADKDAEIARLTAQIATQTQPAGNGGDGSIPAEKTYGAPQPGKIGARARSPLHLCLFDVPGRFRAGSTATEEEVLGDRERGIPPLPGSWERILETGQIIDDSRHAMATPHKV
jgi:hypothetical protein